MKKYLLRIIQKFYRYEQLIVLMLLVIIAFLYYRDIFSFWFVSDDAAAMVSSTETLRKIFFDHIFSHYFYTPLVALSFKPDVMIFGINPFPFHIHNTIILILIAFMVYRILREYTDTISSVVPALIVLLSLPSLICLLWITLRQYLYGMLFALFSIFLFLKYQPDIKKNRLVLIIILIFTELSFMGKEQFMTLPFVLFMLAKGGFKERLYKTLPYFLLFAGHFILRFRVLRGLGGYLGVEYDPIVYMKTTYESIFTASKVLFGYPWIVLLAGVPLLLKIRSLFLSISIWLTSLMVSFLVMYQYPQVDMYRYWLIPAVLFSFWVGFNSNAIKSIFLKISYSSIILALFLMHSLALGNEIKGIAGKEMLMAERTTRALFDQKYREAIILFPESNWMASSTFIEHISTAYQKIHGIKAYSPFYPLELLSFYPKILNDFRDIYEIKEGEVLNISDSIHGKIEHFDTSVSDEKPHISLLKQNNIVNMNVKCASAQGITGFKVRNLEGRPYTTKYIAPYIESVNLTNAFDVKDAEVLPRGSLSYDKGKWLIDGMPLSENYSFLILTCVNNKGAYTQLSDIISFRY